MPPTQRRPATVSEERLEAPLAPGREPLVDEVLAAAGFDALVARFGERLRGARTLAELSGAVVDHGRALWRAAVDRAQADGAGRGGDLLDPLDDRPLYWARLAGGAALRALDAPPLASGPAAGSAGAALQRQLDRASRGLDGPLWPPATGGDGGGVSGEVAVRVAVSGFDPFGLDEELRRSNPSGAAALALHGRRFETPTGTALVRAVVLPVSWGAFDEGIVEDAFGPVLREGPDRADVVMTISQTARGRMDVEAWAANTRGGAPDNDRARSSGQVSRPSRWPAAMDSPPWIATTLPWRAMVDAGTGPWPVVRRAGVREWPAGTHPDPSALREVDEPAPDSTPAAGTGGDYLSNESMYRANRLRLALGADGVAGGHLHISALEPPADPAALRDAASDADRRAVVEQTVALVRAAAGAVAARAGSSAGPGA